MKDAGRARVISQRPLGRLTDVWATEVGLSVFTGLLVLDVFVVSPLANLGVLGTGLIDVVFSLLLICGAIALHPGRILQVLVVILVGIAIGLRWMAAWQPTPWIVGAGANPGRPVVAVVGDGGFLFSVNELATAVKYRLPIAFIVMNDDRFGAIKWLQVKIFGRWGEADLANPDFPALARAFGARGERAIGVAADHGWAVPVGVLPRDALVARARTEGLGVNELQI